MVEFGDLWNLDKLIHFDVIFRVFIHGTPFALFEPAIFLHRPFFDEILNNIINN